MNKKFLSLVLALVMVLGTFGNVFAAAAPEKKEVKEVPKLTTTEAKVQWLIDNKIVVGIADKDGKAIGDMDLKSPIRRDAVSKMLVFAIGEQDLAAKLQGVYTPFPDVKVDNIMNGFISAAASRTANGVPLIVGYEDGMFRPTNNVTYAELAKMLVVAIDKDLTPAVAKTYSWPQGWMDRAARLGIFEGLSIADANKPAVRSDAFAMIYNAFYQLKELKAVPSNETRGVISERSDGTTLVLNQGDFKKEFKVTKDTVFVNQQNVAKKWIFNNAAAQNYYIGSVVRVLSDKDGVVTHIIEMGNPVNGIANRNAAWEDLGNQTLNVRQSAWNPSAKDVTLGKDSISIKGSTKSYAIQDKKELKVVTADASYDVTSKTVFYVADPDKNVLTQVKDYAAAKALVADKNNMTTNVYLAYETLPSSAVKEAKVVVFNKANVEMNKQLVRVTAAVSAPDYMLKAQKPGEAQTEVLKYNLSKVNNVWPYNYKLEAFDVVKLAVSADGKSSNADRDLVIDYSEAPIFKVEKFLLVENGKETEVDRAHANAVLLRDREDFVRRYDLPTDYNKFFGNQFTVGSHVQIAFRANSKVILDVVSVVNHDLRGNLEGGIDTKLVKGKLAYFTPAEKNGELNRVGIIEEGNMRATDFVTALDLEELAKDKAYVEVETNYFNKHYNLPEIKRLVKSEKPAPDPAVPADEKAVVDELNKLKFEGGKLVVDENTKATLEAAKTKQAAVADAGNKEVLKLRINELIKEYNNSDADKNNDIELIK